MLVSNSRAPQVRSGHSPSVADKGKRLVVISSRERQLDANPLPTVPRERLGSRSVLVRVSWMRRRTSSSIEPPICRATRSRPLRPCSDRYRAAALRNAGRAVTRSHHLRMFGVNASSSPRRCAK